MLAALCAGFGLFWLATLAWMLALPIPGVAKVFVGSLGTCGIGGIAAFWRWSVWSRRLQSLDAGGTSTPSTADRDRAHAQAAFWWRSCLACWLAMLLVLLASAVAARFGVLGPVSPGEAAGRGR